MPRPYQLGQRQETIAHTRARILAAARALLSVNEGFAGFSIEAVARQADVARVTIYYQFGSKVGLLEALSDDLADRGEMDHLVDAFRRPDPYEALADYIAVFGRFWSSDRLATRRLRALAALDPDFARVIRARDDRRRAGLRVIVQRLVAHRSRPDPASVDEAVDVLHMLTSFESFDTLAGPTRSPADITPLVQRLARAALDLDQR